MIYFGREFCQAKLHQNKDCPICCIIHSTDEEKLKLGCNKPKMASTLKQGKNILYYSDRVKEIENGANVVRLRWYLLDLLTLACWLGCRFEIL